MTPDEKSAAAGSSSRARYRGFVRTSGSTSPGSHRLAVAVPTELAEVRAAIRELEDATFSTFTKADQLLRLCRRAPDLFVKQTYEEQARLVKLIDTNSWWDNVTLRPIYRKPFDVLAEGLECTTGGADRPLYPNFRRFWRGVGRLKAEPAGELAGELVAGPVGELAAA